MGTEYGNYKGRVKRALVRMGVESNKAWSLVHANDHTVHDGFFMGSLPEWVAEKILGF